eukprot:scaffold193485_cov32-Tisochrysis_lutea.AAC.3
MASRSPCVLVSRAMGDVVTTTGVPPYGPTASSRREKPTSSAVGQYSRLEEDEMHGGGRQRDH